MIYTMLQLPFFLHRSSRKVLLTKFWLKNLRGLRGLPYLETAVMRACWLEAVVAEVCDSVMFWRSSLGGVMGSNPGL